jgi:hypothetical protein
MADNLKSNGRLVRPKSSCRFQWKRVVFLRGLHFPYNETTTWNRLEEGISLKVLDNRVTSP